MKTTEIHPATKTLKTPCYSKASTANFFARLFLFAALGSSLWAQSGGRSTDHIMVVQSSEHRIYPLRSIQWPDWGSRITTYLRIEQSLASQFSRGQVLKNVQLQSLGPAEQHFRPVMMSATLRNVTITRVAIPRNPLLPATVVFRCEELEVEYFLDDGESTGLRARRQGRQILQDRFVATEAPRVYAWDAFVRFRSEPEPGHTVLETRRFHTDSETFLTRTISTEGGILIEWEIWDVEGLILAGRHDLELARELALLQELRGMGDLSSGRIFAGREAENGIDSYQELLNRARSEGPGHLSNESALGMYWDFVTSGGTQGSINPGNPGRVSSWRSGSAVTASGFSAPWMGWSAQGYSSTGANEALRAGRSILNRARPSSRSTTHANYSGRNDRGETYQVSWHRADNSQHSIHDMGAVQEQVEVLWTAEDGSETHQVVTIYGNGRMRVTLTTWEAGADFAHQTSYEFSSENRMGIVGRGGGSVTKDEYKELTKLIRECENPNEPPPLIFVFYPWSPGVIPTPSLDDLVARPDEQMDGSMRATSRWLGPEVVVNPGRWWELSASVEDVSDPDDVPGGGGVDGGTGFGGVLPAPPNPVASSLTNSLQIDSGLFRK